MKMEIPRYTGVHIAGLPDRAWVLTNSERMSAACPRRYWFRYTENLEPKDRPAVLRLGTAWHSVMEVAHRWWMTNDSSVPKELLFEQVEAFYQLSLGLVEEGYLDLDAAIEQVMKLRRAVDGWIEYRGLDPYVMYKVVAVEIPLAAPIVNPDSGRPFRPSGYVMRTEKGLREARTGEAPEATLVRWPYYQVGRLDAVLAHRTTGVVWALDHKFTSQPQGYIRNALYDPQLPGYCWLLQYNISKGYINGIDKRQVVGGFIYEIASSQMQQDPKLLKSGKFSCASNARVPSWRFIKALDDEGVECTKAYEEYIESLKIRVDNTLYFTEWLTITSEHHRRYIREIYGEAARLSTLKRQAVKLTDVEKIYTTHPRVPICRLPGGSCPYKAPCFHDGIDVRQAYEVKDGIQWVDAHSQSSDLPVEIDGKVVGRDIQNEVRRTLGW